MVQCVWIPDWRFKSSLDRLQRRRWEFWQWKAGVSSASVCSAEPKQSRCNEEDHPWRWPYFASCSTYLLLGHYLTLSSAAILDCNGGKDDWLCMKRTTMEENAELLVFFLVGPYKFCGGFTASCPWARGLRCFLLLARYLTVKSFKVIVSFVLLNELYRWNTLSVI